MGNSVMIQKLPNKTEKEQKIDLDPVSECVSVPSDPFNWLTLSLHEGAGRREADEDRRRQEAAAQRGQHLWKEQREGSNKLESCIYHLVLGNRNKVRRGMNIHLATRSFNFESFIEGKFPLKMRFE